MHFNLVDFGDWQEVSLPTFEAWLPLPGSQALKVLQLNTDFRTNGWQTKFSFLIKIVLKPAIRKRIETLLGHKLLPPMVSPAPQKGIQLILIIFFLVSRPMQVNWFLMPPSCGDRFHFLDLYLFLSGSIQ